jgi:hypothetical protein
VTTEDHLGWDEFGYHDILVAMDTPQAEEVGSSLFTQASPVGTQPTQPVRGATTAAGGATLAGAGSSLVGGGTPAGGATPAGGGKPMGGATPAGGGTPDVAGSSQAAMTTPTPDQLRPRVVRPPDP